jgi:predicted Zn-dependent protease with MMP-like domain
MTIDAFEAVVEEAVRAVPDHLQPYLDTVQVVTDAVPNPGQRHRMRLRDSGGLYGLYEGWTVPQRLTPDFSGMGPSVVTVFRIALRRDFPDDFELVREIRHTVWHELAHHFGISDDELESWGVY